MSFDVMESWESLESALLKVSVRLLSACHNRDIYFAEVFGFTTAIFPLPTSARQTIWSRNRTRLMKVQNFVSYETCQ